ncbi:hypothetical protein KOR42_05820 [Thalassoglobus neptunius]|uniref:Uncharacterized protein n=1 Tax=Thalassoglobus neptunius TaxID=1938619 RepID=A0A5C5X268_9PLAN|nr:MT-A70 family methyltransferase [Thalassoglobus neptunius]TWT57224.1 hypothetical protein KOR42_05820 [Thalassoglobus neptunius]
MAQGFKTPYKDLAATLSGDERRSLEDDIAIHGVLQPILVDEEDNILDGHNRYSVCKDVPYRVVEGLTTDAHKRAFVLSHNLKRLHLTPERKAEIRQRMQDVARKLREEDPKKWTQEQLGRLFGVSHQAVEKWLDINNATGCKANKPDARLSIPREAKQEIFQRVDKGHKQSDIAADFGISQGRVSQIARQVKAKKEAKRKIEEITANEVKQSFGKLYDVIVIDPPWPMEKIDREVAPDQGGFDYPTMSEEELSGMVMPARADCHLWLWTTQRFLPMSLRLLGEWGFKYVCAFVWHKPGGFQPIGLPQYNCEFAIYARKGAPRFVDTKAFNSCFTAPRGRHSEKPEEFYDVVRRVTDGDRIDIFNRRSIDGFDVWGNEA